MPQSSVLAAAALAIAAACAGAARADTLYSAGPTAAMESPGAVAASFAGAAGAGNVSFQLQGYNSLDGDNFWIDILHVTLNGSEIFSASYDLGGGGTDRVLLDSLGATATKNGVTVDVSIPVSLLAGSNSLVIAYDSPFTFEGFDRAGPQGLNDEGWGLNTVLVTGAVPEPATYLMCLAGLSVLGLGLCRRA